jgi:dolichyl-phosphate-mannose--protein O-mannosyl transferase
MNTTTLACLGIGAGLLQFIGMVPYFVDIVRRKTKPERATWWIWSLLNAVSLAAQIGAHARWSLLMTIGQSIVTLAVALLSLTHGYGTFHKKDLLAIVFALGGVGLWWLLNSPMAALLVVLAVDLVGFWLTIEKTWRAPETETLLTWVLCTVSGALGVLAVGKLNITQLLYPLYIMLGNLIMVAIIIGRRPVQPAKQPED